MTLKAVAGGGSSTGALTPSQQAVANNNNRLLLPRFARSVSRIRNKLGNSRVSCVGNSQTRGLWAINNTVNDVQDYNNNWVANLANSMPFNTEYNSFFGNGNFNSSPSDGRVTIPAAWNSNSVFTLGGTYFCASSAGTMSFLPDRSVDRFEIFYDTGSSTASFSYNIDGGSNTTINQNTGSDGMVRLVINAATLGSHTLNINWVSGQSFITGFGAWNSAISQMQFDNCGWPGGKMTQFATANVGVISSPLTSLSIVAPDLVIIEGGQNDLLASVPVTTILTALQAMVTYIQPFADIVIVNPIPLPSSSVALVTQGQYSAGVINICNVNNVPCADMFNRWVSYVYSNNLGLYGGDNVHPNGLGYPDYATCIKEAMSI